MSENTLLSINGIDFSDYAVRGITMTLKPIGTGDLVRDVNGNLVDLTLPQFRKYEISIECRDQEAPTLDDVWIGQEIDVVCIPGLGVASNTDGTLSITAMVVDWQTSRDEWQSETTWSIRAVEI